ncbi:MAG TPA: PAS domain S-box protein, partial [Actinotalea sp.]
MTTPDERDPWELAPAALLTLDTRSTILRANATFLRWVGLEVADLDAGVRFTSLLSVGGRIYWETHLSPLLLVEGHVDEVALELR